MRIEGHLDRSILSLFAHGVGYLLDLNTISCCLRCMKWWSACGITSVLCIECGI